MRKFTRVLYWCLPATLILLQACSKSGSSGGGGGATPPPPPPPGSSLGVTLSKTQIFADGWEETKITVKDQNNNDVTSSSTLYLDNVLYFGTNYYTTTPGTRKFKAVKGAITSPEVTLTAIDPGPSPFSQKILVEDYTGTWCGYCPRVGISLGNYINNGHPTCILISNHGPNLNGPYGDPMWFPQHATMANTFGITGYPGVIVDRDFKWNEVTSQLNAQFTNRRPPAGLAIQSSISSNTINVTAKVKFDVTTDVDLKLVVYLLEDGIVYPQVNYGYNYYGNTANPLNNYVHNATLRLTGTDIYGDLIPKSSQVKGTVFSKDFSFNAAGYNITNCRIVAFVVVSTNTTNSINKKGVVNVQTVNAGENKDFD